jgi:hypothetical protein
MNRQGTKVPVTNLRSLLHSLVLNTEGDDVTVRQLLTAIGRRAYGPVLLLLGFVSISPLTIIPGANWFMATVTLIFALQIVVGRKTPWLPKRTLDFSFKRDLLIQGVAASEKYAYMLDALVRPRLHFLTESPFVQIVGVFCVLVSLTTYPLGLVPLGPLLPGLTILLFGLGLTARDGFVVLLAALSFVAAMFIVFHMLPQLIGLWPF